MRPLTVGALGDLAYAQSLGKKSTESDIQLASFREGDALVSMVLPLRFPEKPQPLMYAVNSADAGLLAVSAVGKELGESILAADAAGLEQGLVVLRNFVQPEQLAPLLKNTTLEKWEVSSDDKPSAVRARLAAMKSRAADGPVRIPVDHHFDVKGVGAVVLGFAAQGRPRKHDTYRVYPTAKLAQVRSVQVHDEDVDAAQPGDHVGMALKGVGNEDLDRGHVLAPEGSLEARAADQPLRLRVQVSKFFKGGLQAGPVYYLALGWQVVPLRFAQPTAAGAAAALEATLQKPLALAKGQRGVLLSLDAPQRVAGGAVVEG